MHVLIIEGERGGVSGLTGFLESRGHVVDTAGSGISGRQPAPVVQYDAIILDVPKPEDGLGLCRKLREGGCTATPILMISQHNSLDDKIACIEAGADDFLATHATTSEIELRLRVLFRMNARVKANSHSGPHR